MLLDRNGNEVAKLHAGVDRVLIPFSEMPESLRKAVVAVEDADSYRHDGIDRMALVRATWRNLTSGSLSQGGSTITQRYVKNVLTGPERSVSRKVREAILAVKLEDTTSKREILRAYLNTVYFGHGAYGVQAAARTYFDRDAKELTLLQSATLAGLISAPSARDPFEHSEEARVARDLALARMAEVGSIGPGRARRLQARPLGLAEEARVRSAASHFMEHVRSDLKASYGLDALYRRGLRVRTTLDMEWQRSAERAIRTSPPSRSDPEAALVAIDPRNGAIRAMVGARSFARSEFNLATQARRQAGSAFKPFVLVAALERGISPLEVRAGPSSITIPDPFCETDGQPWSLSNAGDRSAGTMSIENAMAGSVNTIFGADHGGGGARGRRRGRSSDGHPIPLGPGVLDPSRDVGGHAAGDDIGLRHPRDAGLLRGADSDRAGHRFARRGPAGAAPRARQRGQPGPVPARTPTRRRGSCRASSITGPGRPPVLTIVPRPARRERPRRRRTRGSAATCRSS